MRQVVLLFGVTALFPVAASAAELAKVRFHVYGAYCAGCAGTLTEALAEAGVQEASKIPPNRGRGYVIVRGVLEEGADLGALAKVVNEADTPHKSQAAPGLALELFAKLEKKSAAAALKALEELHGVDAQASQADPRAGIISVKLSGDEKVTVADILDALKKAGVDARAVAE